MSFFDDVESEVRDFSSGGVRVSDYRLALSETTGSSLGVESNRVGSPYAPLGVTELGGGGFVVRFGDGTISKGALTRAPRAAIREMVSSAFEGRYEDPEEANFPGEAEVPEVELRSAEAERIADGADADALPELLDVLMGARESAGARLVDSSTGATRIRKRVVSSGGFRAECCTTRVGFNVALDSLVWVGHGGRAPFALEDVRERVERVVEDYRALKSESPEQPRGRFPVILHPRTTEAFLRRFLFTNLSGNGVANGRSRFSAEDFRDGRAVLREDLSLVTDPLVPLGPGSFRFTDEGVVARPVELIAGGRLRTPMLGLKSARKLGMAPAPVPSSIEGFALTADGEVPLSEALAGEGVLVVHSVLGMHTQDAVRGEYSLLCPQAVLYEGGRAKGRVKATLNGSMFDDLESPELRLVRFPGFDLPGLGMPVEVS